MERKANGGVKVLIEASEAYRNQAGIGRFGRALIDHLPANLEVAFSPADYAEREHSLAERTFSMRLMNFTEHIFLTQQRVLSAVRQTQPTLIHSLSFFVPLLVRNIPTIATIFDLAYFDLPDETDRFWGLYGRRMMPTFARRASAIITTSEVSRERIVDQFDIEPEKVFRVYGGVDAHFHQVTESAELERVREKYQLYTPFALYVGAWHATKNLPLLLEAFQGIEGTTLVLTGEPFTPEQRGLPQLAATLNIDARFIGHVPDTDLPTLYSLARMAVLPSLYEGFGLPAIEAMACGTPVVISDIPVLKEITDGSALSFPVNSADDLRDVLLYLFTDDDAHAEWRARAQIHAKHFNWHNTANDIINIWRQVSEPEQQRV